MILKYIAAAIFDSFIQLCFEIWERKTKFLIAAVIVFFLFSCGKEQPLKRQEPRPFDVSKNIPSSPNKN